jgi:2-dehydro-3-deoxygluconokinase
MLEIVSLGEPMAEFCATTLGKLNEVELFKRGWGGDTSNFIITAARLGCRAGYICRIGNDVFGASFLEIWSREGIDTSHVIIEEGGFTGVYFISLLPNGKHDFTYLRKNSAASHLSPEDLDEGYIKGIAFLHSSGITAAISRSCRDAVFKAFEMAKSHGVNTSFDINFRPKLWSASEAIPTIQALIKMTDVLFASLEDLSLLYGFSDFEEAANAIMKIGPKIMVIKLGEKGCLVKTRDSTMIGEPFNVEVVDTTGAGDAFDAAFVTGLLRNWGLEKTISFANAVGALTTTGLGAVAPIPKLEAVKSFLERKGVRL